MGTIIEHSEGATDTNSDRDKYLDAIVNEFRLTIMESPTSVLSNSMIEKISVVFGECRERWMKIQVAAGAHPTYKREITKAVQAHMAKTDNVFYLSGSSSKIRSIIDGAPVSEEATAPKGWVVSDELGKGMPCLAMATTSKDGTTKDIPVSTCPIVVSRISYDINTALESITLGWKKLGRWHSATVPRENVADSRKIVDMRSYGFPVDSNTSREVVKYISDYENCNLAVIERKHKSSQLGWQGDEGKWGFLHGKDHIVKDDSKSIEFAPSDSGDNQLAAAIRTSGDIEIWKKAMSMIKDYPIVQTALYASFVPPMLQILNVPNFIVDWSYQTSSGKTTMLSIAGSVWGNPDVREPDSIINSWDSTAVWVERAASVRNHMPVILDDSKRAMEKGRYSPIPRIVYALTNGQGRGRGSIKGTQETRYWRTVVLSTGEQRLIDFSKDGGTATRVVTIWGNPWDEFSPAIAALQGQLEKMMSANYGHAGKEWVTWLNKHRDGRKEEWQKMLTDFTAMYAGYLAQDSSGAATRIAKYLATIEVVGRLIHDAIDLPWDYKSPIPEIIERVKTSSKNSDRASEALLSVVDAASSCRELFYDHNHPDRDPPPQGWWGRWDRGSIYEEEICYYQGKLFELLRKSGHEPESTVQIWKDRGWLNGDSERPNRKVTVYGGDRIRLFCIAEKAIRIVGLCKAAEEKE